jgi:hypothetical protein
MYNGQYFQPPVFDKFTKWHFILSLIAFIALFFAFKGLFQAFNCPFNDNLCLLIVCLIVINSGGFIYEYGEATGWGSKEGIDPLDLLMNFIGSFIGMIFIRILYGV